MRGHEEATIDMMNSETRLRDAASFAVDVLMHCVADGPGCDDADARQTAIRILQAALRQAP